MTLTVEALERKEHNVGKITFRGKGDTIYDHVLYAYVPIDRLGDYRFGDEYELVPMVKTMPPVVPVPVPDDGIPF